MALGGKNAAAIYEALSQRDVQGAADELRSVYDKTEGKDGLVRLEVNPHLAHDTQGTIQEARRLWGLLNRPNVFIKVPATPEGLPAIQLIEHKQPTWLPRLWCRCAAGRQVVAHRSA